MILFYSNKTWKRSFDSAQDDKRIDVILSEGKWYNKLGQS